uniref:Uncharacterized protein n=1 Tax=Chloropicon laureae TaxID=464258 RepID=A0A7S2Z1S0_9CHLO|mmetsp:Transcript_14426/g.37161  ORF Transcript_14426/g.37161 Transcript_14426/m.37161 type:complete len:243 (+) Transcript_14426:42-770(+)
MVKSRVAKVRDLFNLLEFENEAVVFLLQTKRKVMREIGTKMKTLTPEWRSSQVRGKLVGLTNTKTGKFETFGYTGPGAEGRVAIAPFLAGENKYLCSVPPKSEFMNAICKEFEKRKEAEEIHVVGGFVHKRFLKEQKGASALLGEAAAAAAQEEETGGLSVEGSEYIALTPEQVLKFSQQQTRGQMALTLFGLPIYMSFLRPLHYTALDLKNGGPGADADAAAGEEEPASGSSQAASDNEKE